MRIASAGISRADPGFEFTFEGRRVVAHAGETVAAALIAAGHWSFRDSRSGAPRGPFCGMGVCGECQVMIDGQSRRACLEPAQPDRIIARHPSRAATGNPTEEPLTPGNWQERTVDVLIVGAGPAGLAAARVAAGAGLTVLVVDERRKFGGQFFKQPGAGFAIDEGQLDAQYSEGRRLYEQALAAGARLQFGATVWAAFAPDLLALVVEGATHVVRARRLILATGAFERAVPVPGWTLPGFITTGAAQTLLRASQVSPGKRVLIAGNGPLNLQVARELSEAGSEVVAVAELAASPLSSPSAALAMALTSPELCLSGVSQLMHLRAHGVPVLYGHALVEVEGSARVERATLGRLDADQGVVSGSQRTFAVDAVCVNHGFMPQNELARALGCEFTVDARTLAWSARCDADGRSSVPGVFIAGDAGGLQGARVAIAQGALAGARVAEELQAGSSIENVARWQRVLRRHQKFQRALWQMFHAPALSTQLAQAQTLLCRCEEVSRSRVEAKLGHHAANFGLVKRATRAGMGSCQGRYCSSLLAALMAQRFAATPRSEDFFAPRAPSRPVQLLQLAGEWDRETAPIDVLRTSGRDANTFP